jgi:hypothetical protein
MSQITMVIPLPRAGYLGEYKAQLFSRDQAEPTEFKLITASSPALHKNNGHV